MSEYERCIAARDKLDALGDPSLWNSSELQALISQEEFKRRYIDPWIQDQIRKIKVWEESYLRQVQQYFTASGGKKGE